MRLLTCDHCGTIATHTYFVYDDSAYLSTIEYWCPLCWSDESHWCRECESYVKAEQWGYREGREHDGVGACLSCRGLQPKEEA
jgi:hypothetical protein